MTVFIATSFQLDNVSVLWGNVGLMQGYS